MPTPLRALVAVLTFPGLALGQFRTAPVGEAAVVPGGGTFNTPGVNAPLATMPAFTNPAVSLVPGAKPSVSLMPSVSNPAVNAAVADPRASAAMPASAFVSQSAAPAPASVRGAEQGRTAESARPEPGALPTFDDPARRTPEGGAGSAALDAGKDLQKAKKDEAEGKNPGAMSAKLDAMFDFSKSRGGALADPQAAAAAKLGEPAVAGLPDPKVLGVEPAVGKLSSLARGAEPAEAPALYQRAADTAREGLSPAESAARVSALRGEAAKRAPKAVQTLADQALSAAAQGRTTDAIRYAKAVHGWDAVVGAPGRPYVENLAEFNGTVKHVLAKALANPGKGAAAPKVRFEPVGAANSALPVAVRARFKFAAAADGPVQALPAALAESLALPELKGFVALDGPEAPAGPELSAAFSLRPEAGFASLFRAARAAKSSAWSAFWVAARQVAQDGAATLWDQVKALFVRFLQAVGVLHSAVPAGPVVLAADPAVLADLRAAAPERVERPAPRTSPDPLGLGYELVGLR